MRRYILLLLVMLSCVPIWAQEAAKDNLSTRDTTDTESRPLDRQSKRPHRSSRQANVLGRPIYYDTNGNVIGSSNPSATYHHPSHHYLNDHSGLDDQFSTFFFEGEGLVGMGDIAGGANFTVLPNRWGIYGSALAGRRHNYFSFGPAVRLSSTNSSLDWHLYGGMMLGGKHIGAEGGLRMAFPKRRSQFCWTSVSAGVAVINGDAYLTMGMSLSVLACLCVGTLFL
ncbi:MAG: hypothetical protein IJU19_08295 [Bacteroidales bacterium]|nr:hypothetical protein [Bacteroidales bacterium]